MSSKSNKAQARKSIQRGAKDAYVAVRIDKEQKHRNKRIKKCTESSTEDHLTISNSHIPKHNEENPQYKKRRRDDIDNTNIEITTSVERSLGKNDNSSPDSSAGVTFNSNVWICEKCTLENKSRRRKCEACGMSSPPMAKGIDSLIGHKDDGSRKKDSSPAEPSKDISKETYVNCTQPVEPLKEIDDLKKTELKHELCTENVVTSNSKNNVENDVFTDIEYSSPLSVNHVDISKGSGVQNNISVEKVICVQSIDENESDLFTDIPLSLQSKQRDDTPNKNHESCQSTVQQHQISNFIMINECSTNDDIFTDVAFVDANPKEHERMLQPSATSKKQTDREIYLNQVDSCGVDIAGTEIHNESLANECFVKQTKTKTVTSSTKPKWNDTSLCLPSHNEMQHNKVIIHMDGIVDASTEQKEMMQNEDTVNKNIENVNKSTEVDTDASSDVVQLWPSSNFQMEDSKLPDQCQDKVHFNSLSQHGKNSTQKKVVQLRNDEETRAANIVIDEKNKCSKLNASNSVTSIQEQDINENENLCSSLETSAQGSRLLFTKCSSSKTTQSQGIKLTKACKAPKHTFSQYSDESMDKTGQECMLLEETTKVFEKSQNSYEHLLKQCYSSDSEESDLNCGSNKNTLCIGFDYDLPQQPMCEAHTDSESYSKTDLKDERLLKEKCSSSERAPILNLKEVSVDEQNISTDCEFAGSTKIEDGFCNDNSISNEGNFPLLANNPNKMLALDYMPPNEALRTDNALTSVQKKEAVIQVADKNINLRENLLKPLVKPLHYGIGDDLSCDVILSVHTNFETSKESRCIEMPMSKTARTRKVVEVTKDSVSKACSILHDVSSSPMIESKNLVSMNSGDGDVIHKAAINGTGKIIEVSAESLPKARLLVDDFSYPSIVDQSEHPNCNTNICENHSSNSLQKDSILSLMSTPIKTDRANNRVNENSNFKRLKLYSFSLNQPIYNSSGTDKVIEASNENLSRVQVLFNRNDSLSTNASIKFNQSNMKSEKSVNRANRMQNDGHEFKKNTKTKRTSKNLLFTASTDKLVTASEQSGKSPFQRPGKIVKVSKESLNRANKLLNNQRGLRKNNESKPSFQSPMSATATSGRKLKVPEERKKQADRMLNNGHNFNSDIGTKPMSHTAMFTIAGSGKKVTVSEESLNRANRMLNDQCNLKASSKIEPTFQKPMFASAGSGKEVKVSEESLIRANNILNNQCSLRNNNESKHSFQNPMSATAGSTKMLKVSEERIDQADRMLNNGHNFKSDIRTKPMSHTAMFTIAGSGKKVKVSEESLNRANRMLSDQCNLKANSIIEPIFQKPMFASAGSGKEVKVSEESLNRANNVLNNQCSLRNNNESKPSFQSRMSTTATSCRTFKVPVKSMNQADRMLNNGHNFKSDIGTKAMSHTAMFTIAGSGKRVAVSEESLNRANRMLNDQCNLKANSKIEPTFQKPMFASAGSGKEVKVSEESLNRANIVLNNQCSLRNNNESKHSFQSPMFATAGSTKMLKVSEERIDQADRMLNNGHNFKSDIRTKPMSHTAMFTIAGSGKKVKVSEESLNRANRMLNDQCNLKASSKIEPTFQKPMFASAGSGKEVKVSEESLNRANNILNNQCSLRNNNERKHSFQSPMFATAGSTKMLKVSEERIDQADRMLNNGHNFKSDIRTKPMSHTAMFTIAGSGKKVKVSEESLNRANRMLNDQCNLKASSKIEPTFQKPMFASAGSGKEVKVSEESLNRANNILNNQCSLRNNNERKHSFQSPMFATAGSTKMLKVSEERIDQADRMLNNGHNFKSDIRTKPMSHTAMFTIAGSGKKVKVSEESLNRANRMLNDQCNLKASSKIEPTFQKPMFASAGSGKEVKVSEESLNRANNILNDQCSLRNNNERKDSFQSRMSTTATSCRTFKVPVKSMNQADRMLNNGHNFNSDIGTKAMSHTAMFTIAGSGKRVTVSEESLNRANRMLNDQCNLKANSKIEPTIQKPMFASAGSGKEVKVSEESLNRANNVLHNLCGLRNENESKHSFQSPISATAESTKMLKVSDDRKKQADQMLNNGHNFKSDIGTKAMSHIAMFTIAGSGKKVKVSEESLNRANRMLNDQCNLKASSKIEPTFQKPMFASAGSGKEVKVSEESLNRANNILNNQCSLRNNNESKHSFQNPMFATAGSTKMLKVSEERIDKADRMLNNGHNFKSDIGTKAMSHTAMFTIAGSGKKVTVSEESLNRANRMLNDQCNLKASSKIDPIFQKPMFASAGSGKEVKVSEESLNRANNVLNNQCSLRNNNERKDSFQNPMSATAGSTKMLKVSEERIDQADRMLNNGHNFKSDIGTKPMSHTAMFTIAGSGKRVAVSEESLNRANRMLNDQCILKANSIIEPIFQKPMFASAGSGKEVKVSEESLNRANNILNDQCSLRNENESKSLFQIPMFATAGSGKTLKVSVESMNQADQMLNNGHNFKSDIETNLTVQSTMFNTPGSGKRVTVSEESLNRANIMLSNQSDSTVYNGMRSPFQTPMFATVGSCKRVKASEESFSIASGTLNNQCASNSYINSNSLSKNPMSPTSSCGKAGAMSEDIVYRANKMLNDDCDLRSVSPINSGKVVKISEESLNRANRMPRDQSDIVQGENVTPSILPAPIEQRSKLGCDASSIYFRREEAITPMLTEERSHYKIAQKLFPITSPVPLNMNTYPVERDVNQHFIDINILQGDTLTEAKTKANEIVTVASLTPLQTPKVVKSAVVTQSSTRIRNPYAKQKIFKEVSTPKILTFHHVSGTFSGKKIPTESLIKASLILSESNIKNDRAKRNVTNMRPQVLDYDEETKHINKKKRSLSQLAIIEGSCNVSLHGRSHNISQIVMQVTSSNSTKLRFEEESELPILFSDGPRTENSTSKIAFGEIRDLHPSLLKLGCKSSLLSNRWIQNHFKWIVWKLACMERRFPALLANRYLTYSRVVSQLHKRYEQELRSAIRPLLRKILNKDASANQPMILCVSGIRTKFNKSEESKAGGMPSSSQEITILELTDGWYSIPAVPDKLLVTQIHRGKIKIGTKLLISNALLTGADDGIDPLDKSYNSKSSSAALKIFYNSTRLAKWDAKLGFTFIRGGDGRFFIRSLSDVQAGGGSIPTIDLIICRQYPRLFLQKQSKHDDSAVGTENNVLVINEFQEHKAQHVFEKNRHKVMDDVLEVAKKESNEEVESIAPIIWKRMMISASPQEYYERRSLIEQREIDKWREKRMTIFQELTEKSVNQSLQERNHFCRESIPFCRFLVRTITPGSSYALLTAWQITDEHLSFLQEGNLVRMRDVFVKDSLRDGKLQLSLNRRSCLCISPVRPTTAQLVESGLVERSYIPIFRTHLHFKRKRRTYSMQQHTEIDTLGYVLKVMECNNDVCSIFRIYMTDESGFLFRLEIEFSNYNDVLPWINTNIEGKIIALRDIQLLFLDEVDNCAVSKWTEKSSFVKKITYKSTHRLKAWVNSDDGKMLCHRLYHSVVTGITPCLSSKYEVLVGYVTRIFSNNAASKEYRNDELSENRTRPKNVLVEIDTAGNVTKKVIFPIFLLESILNTAIPNDYVNMEEEQLGFDELCNRTEYLERIFRNSGILFHFVLNRSDGKTLEVERVKKVSSQALCQLHKTFYPYS